MPAGHNDTVEFSLPREARTARDVLLTVYDAMRERGYDPVNQIVGYLLSGDPTYIMERDELIEELVRFYVEKRGGE